MGVGKDGKVEVHGDVTVDRSGIGMVDGDRFHVSVFN